MFSNIGNKIKIVAVIQCVLGVFASWVTGISMIINESVFANEESIWLSGVLLIIGGSIISWIGSILIYGFGELIEGVCRLEEKIDGPSQPEAMKYSPADEKKDYKTIALNDE